MRYSIIFLVERRDDGFGDFLKLIVSVFEAINGAYEVLIVANGVEDFVRAQLSLGKNHVDTIKLIVFHRPVPQAVCLKAAVDECQGSDIMINGSVQELSDGSYLKIINSLVEGTDVVVPNRKRRKDPFFNWVHSQGLNRAIGKAAGIELHDIGCQTKMFRREVIQRLEIYGGTSLYLSLLAAQKGFNIREIECEQYEKTRATRLYDFRTYLERLIDILNLFFGSKFSKKPLRFFNLLGSICILGGVMLFAYIGLQKIMYHTAIGSRPLLIVALISLVAGTQIASIGLLAEIVAFIHGRSRKEYSIEKII